MRRIPAALLIASALVLTMAGSIMADPSQQRRLLISDVPATISPTLWPWTRIRSESFTFLVTDLGDRPGGVTVAALGIPGTTFCMPGIKPTPVLRITGIPKAGVRVTAVVPGDALRRAAANGKLNVIVADGKEWIEIPVTISTNFGSITWTPVVWFWSIAVPAAISGFIAMKLSAWSTARQQERDDKRAWLNTLAARRGDLDVVFGDYLAELVRTSPARWTNELESRLEDLIPTMPARHRDRVVHALRRGHAPRAIVVLGRAFPFWREVIRHSVEGR